MTYNKFSKEHERKFSSAADFVTEVSKIVGCGCISRFDKNELTEMATANITKLKEMANHNGKPFIYESNHDKFKAIVGDRTLLTYDEKKRSTQVNTNIVGNTRNCYEDDVKVKNYMFTTGIDLVNTINDFHRVSKEYMVDKQINKIDVTIVVVWSIAEAYDREN